MNRLSHTSFEHKGLKTAFKKVLDSKGQHVIELVLALIKQTISVHSPHKGFTLKDPTRVLLLKGQKHSCSITDTAQGILHPPELTLASKTVFTDKLQLSVQTFLLVRTAWLLECLTI
ncbi:hypothetical protein Hanom_Chr15g01389221 [Helianthus anomalus]